MSDAKGPAASLLQFCRENPYTAVLFVAFVVAGAAIALLLPFDGSMSPTRRALAGAFAGAFLALFPVGARLFD